MKKNPAYIVKSPMRMDLAGGLLDVWPVYALVKDCFVINCSIPVFTSVELQKNNQPVRSIYINPKKQKKINIEISSPSGSYKKSFSDFEDLLKASDEELNLLKKNLEYWIGCFKEKREGWDIFLRSESPVGAGLGASSSLFVSLTKAFSSVLRQHLSQDELLSLCRDLETALLHSPAGIQDYIPAMGSQPDFLYMIECTPFGPKWKKRKAPLTFFKDHLLLIDTGGRHHSGNNNWKILKKIIEKDQNILSGLNQLKDNALKMMEICEEENWSDLCVCLQREQELRARFFSNWLTSPVLSLINMLAGEGAEGMKLCGAGGGGCLIVLAKNKKKKKNIERICEKNNISVVMNWL